MKAQVKAAIITGGLGIVATVIGSLISFNSGIEKGNTSTMSEIETAIGNVTGDYANVTINDIGNFVKDYEDVQQNNEELKSLNKQYYELLNQNTTEIESLKTQVGDTPILSFQDLKLSINGEDKPINTSKSMVIIDGREYLSKEFIENLLNGETLTIKDGNAYIGKVIKDKASLFDQWLTDSYVMEFQSNINDSYGNIHSKAMVFYNSGTKYAVFNVNNEFSYLKCTFAIKDNAVAGKDGIITIKADSDVVYTSPNISKTTKPFTVEDIPINNCSLLTIEYTSDGNNNCIVSNAILYN